MANENSKGFLMKEIFKFPSFSPLIEKNPTSFFLSFFLSFFFFFFSLPHLQQMEVPRLGFELDLQLLAYSTATTKRDLSLVFDLHLSLQQPWILNPLSKARGQTQILMDTSQVHNLLSHSGNCPQVY